MNFLRSCGAPVLVLATVLLNSGAEPTLAHWAAGDDRPPEAWYAPQEADFRGAYDRDAANRRTQTWDQYWSWIRSFYDGNFLAAGWTKHMGQEVAVVRNAPARAALIAQFNRVGRQIAEEWAKDDAVRKINTTDLKRWNQAIDQARAAEDGSGDRLKAAVQVIEAELGRKLTPPANPAPK